MKHATLLHIWKLILLFGVYFISAKIGLLFDAVSGFASLVWIPSGISLAALLLFGYRLWPAVALGAFSANFLNGAPLSVAAAIGIGNTLEAIAGVFLLRRAGFEKSFESLRDVFLLAFVAAPLTSFISATIGVSSLFFSGIILASSYAKTWIAWWIGDTISILIITPLCLVWRTLPSGNFRLQKIFETGAFFCFCSTIFFIVFHESFGLFPKGDPITYIMFLPLIWSGLRFGIRINITVVFILSLFAVFETVQGFGPFAQGRLSDKLLHLQGFIGVIGLTSMIIAAIVSEKEILNQRKDEFIGLAGHELKTPLTSIKMFNQFLQKKLSKKTDRSFLQYLQKMDRQIDRLTVLINSLLDISKIRIGQLEQHPENFSLVDLIKDSIEILRPTVKNHILIIKKNVKGDVKVFGDRERINQVILNLVGNAVKYSPKANKVIITTKIYKNEVIVSVQDYGTGIGHGNHKKIFKRYFRVAAVNKGASGLGVGLYISHQIIKANNGRMWVDSKQGRGSTFYFSLPYKKDSSIEKLTIKNIPGKNPLNNPR